MAHTITFDKVWNKVRNLPRLTTDNVEAIRYALKTIFKGHENLLHKPIDWYVDNGIDLRTIYEISSKEELEEMQSRYRDEKLYLYENGLYSGRLADASSKVIRAWMKYEYGIVFIDWYSQSEEEILIYLRNQDWPWLGCNMAGDYGVRIFQVESHDAWAYRRSKYHVKSFIENSGFRNIYEVPVREISLPVDLSPFTDHFEKSRMLNKDQPDNDLLHFVYNGPMPKGLSYNCAEGPFCRLSAEKVERFEVRMYITGLYLMTNTKIICIEIFHAYSDLGASAMRNMFAVDKKVLDYITSESEVLFNQSEI